MIKKTKDGFLELILDNIPSPDTRMYLKKITWNPTEEEIATILCNLRLPIVEEIKNLREYAACVSSEELKNSMNRLK